MRILNNLFRSSHRFLSTTDTISPCSCLLKVAEIQIQIACFYFQHRANSVTRLKIKAWTDMMNKAIRIFKVCRIFVILIDNVLCVLFWQSHYNTPFKRVCTCAQVTSCQITNTISYRLLVRTRGTHVLCRIYRSIIVCSFLHYFVRIQFLYIELHRCQRVAIIGLKIETNIARIHTYHTILGRKRVILSHMILSQKIARSCSMTFWIYD